jgi:hypothetical protein
MALLHTNKGTRLPTDKLKPVTAAFTQDAMTPGLQFGLLAKAAEQAPEHQ